MRKLQYLLCTKVNVGSKESPVLEERLARVEMEYNEKNLAIAQAEAHQGVYEIVEKEEAEQKIQ